ncbi:ABC transporter permease [Brachybacterium alimentarium]|uniref:ABC transporter permease n=1 Tax=Brachybacterium alimentarium TaxID=47845 RepID=A0A2A3YJ57_9MICO|nr:ABC transporter permease [Brachybacterium alimentarium]PCC33611.1 ABC transporter permease [Brachybacterium alimentarium]PCC39386.1 ABC transporter permease [Brachybacterium alimentarium]RCS74553.1 ABC transporter permease [Brachybacterium alimentarium]RCS75299.1 ABC transporter permease [Brachybacterium alimentarium]RCS91583.1 ABC transporter permease [Brachybacterium alimentarium]
MSIAPTDLETADAPHAGAGASPPADGRRSAPWAWGLLGVVAAVLAWWALTAVGGAGSPMLAALSPWGVPQALASLLSTGVLLEDLLTSTTRLLLGLLIATVLGVPLGALIGLHRPTRWASGGVVQFVRMISPLSWAPVAVALLGVGSAPVVFLVAAAAVWPIVLGTSSAVMSIDQRFIAVAHTLGARRGEILRTVVVPSVRPAVLQSVRMALGISWVVLVPAEMLGVTSGLGYEILNARDRLAYDEMIVVILVIGALGAAIDALARLLLTPRRRSGRPLPA